MKQPEDTYSSEINPMYWNRSAADIAAAWQAEIESKLETGATAVLLGGTHNNLSTGAATLLGLQNSAVLRNDVATPLLVAGGNSATWLGLLLAPQPSGSTHSAPPPTLVYSGVDEATYLAVVGLTNTMAAQPLSTTGAGNANMAQEMGVHFAPRLQPGATTAWEMLPFVEVGEQPPSSLALIPGATNAPSHHPGDPTADWIAWGVMLLAFCLVLSALLI